MFTLKLYSIFSLFRDRICKRREKINNLPMEKGGFSSREVYAGHQWHLVMVHCQGQLEIYWCQIEDLLMSNRRSTGASSSTTRPASASNRSRNTLGNDSSSFRQRCLKSLIPLHSAVAAAKLVSHLSFNSRTGSALPLGILSAFSSSSLYFSANLYPKQYTQGLCIC